MSEENLSTSDTNSVEGLAPVVQNHYNSLGNNGLQERERSRILHMRNFNNWTKSMLIREYIAKRKEDKPEDSPFHVLDLGAGKGGDLLKWKKGDISYLICADIAGTSLQHAEERFRELKERHRRQREPGRIFQAEFIEADCTRVRLKDRYKYKDIALDLVSCQFTFHYSFESLPQAQCMLRNAAECLVPGGYFIGTTPDANDLVRRVREAPGLKFGNDVFYIEFHGSKDELPLFGAQYDFHLEGVVDCPEFLVNFDVLEDSRLSYIAAALAGSPGTRVAIAVIATHRNRLVGGVHFRFVTAELAETNEDGDDKRIDDAFHKLSLFPAAVPPEVSADDFEEADCSVQAVASLADEDVVAAVAGTQNAQADSSSGNEDRLDKAAATRACSAAEVAAAFGSIHRFYGDME
ncbi:hypothetical protein HPB52_012844 [Rhipicephalus sanguineus]|uniref:mRNA (guanine-N(7))-methyltransferase n=1 Tax=Rhipicephalus sanguineus TaxID=34632 RepID=A0A9D4PU37_RHISA|nr:hypothetical protein HPB52_012844 [Rhipicephalus sanguineus]